MKRILHHELFFVFLLSLLIFLPFFPLLFQGKTFIDSGMVYCDLTRFYYALKVWYKSELLHGSLPFWTNNVGNGYPVFAEGQTAILYPFNLLFYFFLPGITAFNLNFFVHFLIAALGTYLFARLSLSFSRAASILSSLAYAFSGYFLAQISYVHRLFVIAYFPLVMLLTDKIARQQKIKHLFLLAIVFALQILAGHNEMFFYSFVLAFVYLVMLLVTGKFNLKPILSFFLSLILAFGICAPQLLANQELVGESQRAGGLSFEGATASIWPWSTLQLFVNPKAFDNYQTGEDYHPSNPTTFSVPTVYGYVGLLPFLLAAVALFTQAKKRLVFIFLCLTLFAFLWAQGRFSQLFAILWAAVPVVRLFRIPVKLLFALEFFLAILSGFGLQWFFLKIKKRAKLVLISGIVVVGLLYTDLVLNNWSLQPLVSSSEWFKAPEVASYLQKNLDPILYQTYSHGTNNLKYTVSGDLLFQKNFQNILPPDFNLIYSLPSNREDFSLFLRRQQLLNSANTSLDIEKEVLGLPAALKKSLALQGVKYLLSDLPIQDPDLKLVKEVPFSQEVDHLAFLGSPYNRTVKIKVDRAHVYENTQSYPRLNFVSRVTVLKNQPEADVLKAVLAADFDPTKEVILEEPINLQEGSGTSVFKVVKYGESETHIKVETKKDGLLVLTRTFYPGWKAFVDDQESKIFRANYAFQAVFVPQGNHLVRFEFRPTHWSTGLAIAGFALLFVLAGLSYSLLKNK